MLDVGSMKCGGCVSTVRKVLERQPGVASASVNLVLGSAAVTASDPGVVGRAAEALTSAGFPAAVREAQTGAGQQLQADFGERRLRELRERCGVRRWGGRGGVGLARRVSRPLHMCHRHMWVCLGGVGPWS